LSNALRGRFCLLTRDRVYDETALEALIKMEVACRLGLESLPRLPKESADKLRQLIEGFCDVTERELERLKPGYKREGT
jgi:hypothetical protein